MAVAGGSTEARARFAAGIAGARPADEPADAARDADLVLVSTPDDAIEAVVTDLVVADVVGEGDLVVHVAGAHGLAPLRRAALAGAGVAACHPAQTVPAGAPDPEAIVGAAWAVTAAPADRGWARELVVQLGGEPHDVADTDRGLYHAALAVGSNAVAAATALARQLLLGARVDDPAAFLAPLVAASTANVLRDGAAAITGPVARGDVGTVAAHLAILDRDLPHLADDYRWLTRVVLDQVRPSLAPEVAEAIARALDHPARDPRS